jgi:hypothetical protein
MNKDLEIIRIEYRGNFHSTLEYEEYVRSIKERLGIVGLPDHVTPVYDKSVNEFIWYCGRLFCREVYFDVFIDNAPIFFCVIDSHVKEGEFDILCECGSNEFTLKYGDYVLIGKCGKCGKVGSVSTF